MTEILPSAILRPADGVPAASAPFGTVVALPEPMVRTVGDIAGLSPRRKRGDGGEVPGADVDTVDALPHAEWSAVAAWLKAGKAVTTRRARLADVAAFVRWLAVETPGVQLLAVTEDHLTHYRDTIATGTARAGLARPGVPLAPATVARRLSSLSSLYGYATRRRLLAANPADPVGRPEVSTVGTTLARTVEEATALVDGAETIAATYPADAAAVALLSVCAVRVGELVALTVGSVAADAGHTMILFRRKGGKTDRMPIPPRVRALLQPLLDDRSPDEPLFVREDGRPFDRWRMTTALRRAATAAGVDHTRLTPHTARATAATTALDAGVPLTDVQELLGHASPVTTQRYNRGRRKLDFHAAYRMASILGGGA
ncbi:MULTISPECIES: tyrosine-type recombinase/integrase [Streptosporangium]|uniref:Integrase n=1 Tax=Streptosporangium brasiliense TaxID=47480 RepID=A0ABT9RII1_9ACTN|nr:tyrosine-type recombinase/integrase [Streptosporangium brasiliense]MDP9868627.1 integrase [Streptosporangium brasiliense]